ncbi:MAG: hypothetical protein RBT30_02130 [Patescibacteria group bacterium]|jgi:hypothetical protein|nr:hypothetical protein [Patescibacteria group bacterium]
MTQQRNQNQAPLPLRRAISVDLTVQGEKYYFSVRTSEKSQSASMGVTITKDSQRLRDITSDQNGFYFFEVTHPQTDVEQKIKYVFSLHQGVEKAEFLLEIPKKTSTPNPKKDDPQKVILIRLKKPNGDFAVFCRVLKPLGYGMKVDVDLLAEGNRHTCSTDDKGVFIWDFPYQVLPGEEKKVEVVVDGVEDHAKINLKKLRTRSARRAGWRGFFDFRTNNGRSRILLVLVAILWLVALFVGTGPAVINQSLFRAQNELSAQEQRANNINAQYFPSEAEIFKAKEVSNGNFKRFIWRAALILTLLLLIYGPLSLREEIAEEFSLAVEKLKDREYAQAGDPWFEKLVAWSGSYAVARSSSAKASTTNSNDQTVASNKQKGLWQYLPVHLVSDAIVEFIPLIMKVMFK